MSFSIHYDTSNNWKFKTDTDKCVDETVKHADGDCSDVSSSHIGNDRISNYSFSWETIYNGDVYGLRSVIDKLTWDHLSGKIKFVFIAIRNGDGAIISENFS